MVIEANGKLEVRYGDFDLSRAWFYVVVLCLGRGEFDGIAHTY